jgi:hypothetical protein
MQIRDAVDSVGRAVSCAVELGALLVLMGSIATTFYVSNGIIRAWETFTYRVYLHSASYFGSQAKSYAGPETSRETRSRDLQLAWVLCR